MWADVARLSCVYKCIAVCVHARGCSYSVTGSDALCCAEIVQTWYFYRRGVLTASLYVGSCDTRSNAESRPTSLPDHDEHAHHNSSIMLCVCDVTVIFAARQLLLLPTPKMHLATCSSLLSLGVALQSPSCSLFHCKRYR